VQCNIFIALHQKQGYKVDTQIASARVASVDEGAGGYPKLTGLILRGNSTGSS
jgi:hypothetical protein